MYKEIFAEMRRRIARWIYPEIWDRYDECLRDLAEMGRRHRELWANYVRVIRECNDLMMRLEVAIEPIKVYLLDRETVGYWDLKELLEREGFRDIEIADVEYYVTTVKTMDNIVKRAWRSIKDKVQYVRQVWDCDNYAELMRVLIAYSTYKAGYDRQVAVGVGWSNTHAYLVTVAKENGEKKVLFYEPQTGERINERTGAYLPVDAFFTV